MRSSLLALVAIGLSACGGDDGSPIDADVDHDAPSFDAAVDAATDARQIDAPVDAPAPPSDNNCTLATAVDRTAANANRTIAFANFAYNPPCMKIAAGQTVTWSGDFSFHPLRAGLIVDGMPTGQAGNPIPPTSNGVSVSATFPAAGTFGFYCNFHWPNGMKGAVYVAAP